MTEYVCTWWEDTGRMTPFVDGISSPIKRNIETGEELSSRDLPAGALTAHKPEYGGPAGSDGLAVTCRLPDGIDWRIDSRASNCDRRDDTSHRCWVRHGTFGDKLTVDKNGHTCSAGGGSILTSQYHGFLRNGKLVPA